MTIAQSTSEITTPINEMSLPELRKNLLGKEVLQRDIERLIKLPNQVALELAYVLSDYARLGQMTENPEARRFRKTLGQLSGVDERLIIDIQPALVEIPPRIWEGMTMWEGFQGIFLNPVTALRNDKIHMPQVHAPLIMWGQNDGEIDLLRPSLDQPGKYLEQTIRNDLTRGDAQKELIEFIYWFEGDTSLPPLFQPLIVDDKDDVDIRGVVEIAMKSL